MKNPRKFLKYRSLNIDERPIEDELFENSLNIVKKWSESFDGFYPKEEDRFKKEIWYCNIPILDSLINEKCHNQELKRDCIQQLVNAAYYLIRTKERMDIKEWSKIVCSISVPNTFMSSVDIFFDEDYYNNYFIRNNIEYKWIKINDSNRSLVKEHDITIPLDTNFKEIGYTVIINDEDMQYQGEIWFIGEI